MTQQEKGFAHSGDVKHAWKNLGLKPLELLDLRKRRTVGEIVEGYKQCSFGARMLGEVADTVCHWAQEAEKPVILDETVSGSALDRALAHLVARGWFAGRATFAQARELAKDTKVVVVGAFSEVDAHHLFAFDRAIFVNGHEFAKPGQVKDGFFPDAVFADPSFVMPVLDLVLAERLDGYSSSARDLMKVLEGMKPADPRVRNLGLQVARGAGTFLNQVMHPSATRFFTLSGAMTVAKMGLVICEMIEREWVQYFACTGAAMAHGLVESLGLKHYKYNPTHGDVLLASHGLNRVTDTLEPEENLDHVADVLGTVLEGVDASEPMSPRIFHALVGKYLAERFPNERAILKAAYEKKVPVCVPAFVDSEVGNDVYTHNELRVRDGRPRIVMDLERDSRVLINMMLASEFPVIFSVGGGVPRNNTQNVAPLIEIAGARLGIDYPTKMFRSGIRIAPDAPHIGHLSGCTYEENMSWRKMDPDGDFTEVRGDATMIWPLYVRLAMDHQDAGA